MRMHNKRIQNLNSNDAKTDIGERERTSSAVRERSPVTWKDFCEKCLQNERKKNVNKARCLK